MLQYNDLTLMQKIKFRIMNPDLVGCVIWDYIEDNKLGELHAHNVNGKIITIHTGAYCHACNNNVIRIDINGYRFGNYHQDMIEDVLNTQKDCEEITLAYCDVFKTGFKVDHQTTINIPRKLIEEVIAIRKKLEETRVFEFYKNCEEDNIKDIDLQFDIINRLGAKKQFFDRLHGYRNNLGWTKKGIKHYKM